MTENAPYSQRQAEERAEEVEERRLTRAELLAAQATRTQLTLEAHERHFQAINGQIMEFTKQLADLQKHQIQRDAIASSQLKAMTILLSCLMFLASAGSILATVLQ